MISSHDMELFYSIDESVYMILESWEFNVILCKRLRIACSWSIFLLPLSFKALKLLIVQVVSNFN